MQQRKKILLSIATFLLCPILFCVGLKISCAGETGERVCFTNTVPPLGSKNLVPNGSFEAGSAGWSSLGHGAGYENAWAPLVPNWGNLAAFARHGGKVPRRSRPSLFAHPVGRRQHPGLQF